MPAMVLARAFRRAGHETVLLTEGRAVEQDMLERWHCLAATLPMGRGGPGLPLRLVRAGMSARRLLRDRGIDLVVGCGGRTSVPTGLAARSLRLPLCLLEQNAVTGRANRLLMPWAERIYLGLPLAGRQARRHARRHARDRRSLLTGTPLREGLGHLSRIAARRSLGLRETQPVVLVTGGSQGAASLNRLVPQAVCSLQMPIQVLHVAGNGNDADVRRCYNQHSQVTAAVWPMVNDMATMYAAADLVICRGGGGTVSELMAASRPAVIVPYPHHKDRQQWHNGHVLEAAGAALVRDEASLNAEGLTRLVFDLLMAPDRLADMGRRARQMAPADPCGRILEDLNALGALD